jgi:hypothetical protein
MMCALLVQLDFLLLEFHNSHNPLGTQVGQFLFGLIFNLTRTFSPLAPPSTVPVRPLSTSAAIVQLNKDLADAALDHSPASGELTFDESLGDEEGEEDDSVNTEVAQKETEEAEPKVLSENHQWLKTTLAQIVNNTTGRFKMPRCYKDGHFWVHPVDPVFALKRAAVSGFAPTGLYLLPIFVWLPHFLPGRPDSFKCECGTRLILNGKFYFHRFFHHLFFARIQRKPNSTSGQHVVRSRLLPAHKPILVLPTPWK